MRTLRTTVLFAALALTACSGGNDAEKVGAASDSTVPPGETSTSVAGDTTLPGATVPGGGGAGTATPGAGSAASGTNGAPGTPGGSVIAIGESDVSAGTGSQPGGGGSSGGSSGASGTTTPTSPATGSSGGSGGSTSGGSAVSATPEECAALRQVLAIVDHPELRALGAQAGCL